MPLVRNFAANTGSPIYSYPAAGSGSVAVVADLSMDFLIRSIVIDNNSGKWLKLTTNNQYIPPFQTGMLISFSGGIKNIRIIVANPTASPNLGSDGTVYWTAFEESLGPSSVLNQAPVQTAVQAGNIYTGTGWNYTPYQNIILACDAGTLAKYQVSDIYVQPTSNQTYTIWRTQGGHTCGLTQVPVNADPTVPAFAGAISTGPTTFPVLQMISPNALVTGTMAGCSGNGATQTCTYPGSIQSGDLLFIFYSCVGGTPSAPTGWTVMPSNNDPYVSGFYRYANGSESGTVTWTTTNAQTFYPGTSDHPTMFQTRISTASSSIGAANGINSQNGVLNDSTITNPIGTEGTNNWLVMYMLWLATTPGGAVTFPTGPNLVPIMNITNGTASTMAVYADSRIGGTTYTRQTTS